MKSVADVLISLGQNMALVLALLFVYQWLEYRAVRLGHRWERVGFGLLFGLAACGGMLAPVELTPGVIMDSRGVLVALAAFFGGWVAGISATLPVCLFRLYLGGAGAWPGTLATVCAMIAGLLFARWLRARPEQVGRRHLIALGLVVGSIFLFWTLVLPLQYGLDNFRQYLLPLAVSYPAGALIIGSLILSEVRRRSAETARDRGTALFRQASQATRIGVWDLDLVTGNIEWSENIEPLIGLAPGTFKATHDSFLKRVHPEDRPMLLSRFREALNGSGEFSAEFRMIWSNGDIHWYSAIGSARQDGDCGVRHLIGVLADISERKQSQQDLEASEARYRRLVERLPICIHELDTEGILTDINRAGLGIMNATRLSDVCGRNYMDIMSPEDRPRVQALYDRAVAGEPSEFEVTPVITGEKRIFSSSFIPLLDNQGKVYRVMGHTIDLTQERAREADLRRLGTAIEQAVESIVITDPNAMVEYVNPAYEKITGYTRAESIGRRISIVKSGIHDEEFYADVWTTISSGQTWQGEFLNRRRNGELYHQRATITPILGPDGQIVNYVSVQHDITHEVELEKQLRRAQKMEALGTLAGGIAHDFNNILHSMLGFCHIARESGLRDPEALDESLREIEQGANRAAALVEQILTFSRTSEVRFSTMSLTGAVEDALRFLRGSQPPSIDIEFHAEPGVGNIFGDPTQIHQLVTNLCTNAFHAMEERGGILNVSVERVALSTAEQTLSGVLPPGDYNLLRVEDNGTGIDPANFDKLFDPFYTTKIVGKGTGLGLSMVHGIATRMDGGIRIDSTRNVGTCVSVFLPASVGELAEQSVTPAARPLPKRGSGSVLFVDDDESITHMISIVLRRQGFEVTTFTSPTLALEQLEQNNTHFDIVVCDLTMPLMDGIELSKRLKALKPGLPILLATGVIDDEKLDAVHETGVREILRKPFHINELIEAINRNI